MLTTQNTFVLLIDVQERLMAHIHRVEEFNKNLVNFLKGVRILEVPFILTEHVPEKLGKTTSPILEIMPETIPIVKNTFSCWGNRDFKKSVKKLGRKKILVAGVETHVCVYQTVADLVQAGFEVQVVSDCVSSRTLDNKNIGLERIKHVGASVTSVETALCELLKIAQGEKFKKIIQLIK
ncbi:MAG: hydrolase [Candidatus Omnitrophota bacterium]